MGDMHHKGGLANTRELSDLKALFTKHGRRLLLMAGEQLFESGQPPDAVYWLGEGELQVHLPEGPLLLKPDNVVGEIAVLEKKVRTARVTAQTDSVLYALDHSEFRDHLTHRTHQSLSELAAIRQEVWPKITVGESEVRLVDLNETYAQLITHMLQSPKILQRILSAAGVESPVKLIEAQFGGRGSIKYVVRLVFKSMDEEEPRGIGVRFYEARLFRSSSKVTEAAHEELTEFGEFGEHGLSIDIWDYVSLDQLAGVDGWESEAKFLEAGVAGFSVGQFLLASEIPADTGVRNEHLSELIATVTHGWLARQGKRREQARSREGPVIGDLKLENFVLDQEGLEGQRVKYIDLGDMLWVSFPGLLGLLEHFVADQTRKSGEDPRLVVDAGVRLGVEAYFLGLERSGLPAQLIAVRRKEVQVVAGSSRADFPCGS